MRNFTWSEIQNPTNLWEIVKYCWFTTFCFYTIPYPLYFFLDWTPSPLLINIYLWHYYLWSFFPYFINQILLNWLKFDALWREIFDPFDSIFYIYLFIHEVMIFGSKPILVYALKLELTKSNHFRSPSIDFFSYQLG